VTSEVGRLRRVLVHEPGQEVDLMTPSVMEELLFDDILHGAYARKEHRLFCRLMQLLDIEVLEAKDLLTESLAQEHARAWVFDLLQRNGIDFPQSLNASSEASVISESLCCGVRIDNPGNELFEIQPLPNWCFQRDPQVVLGSGVVFPSMATPARQRESILSQVIFRFHPKLKQKQVILDMTGVTYKLPHKAARLEGGDVLILSEQLIAVGCSKRTSLSAIQALARALSVQEEGPKNLIVVEVPKKRAYMHLDTIMTPISETECLVFPPVMLAGGREEARAFAFDLKKSDFSPVAEGNFLTLLKNYGHDYTPIPCGGWDPLSQQREQWTDGANAFALAPGVITLYDRNMKTVEELSRHGYRVMKAEDVVLGKEEISLDKQERLALLLPSHEISRARGGPHCLTHPLFRELLC